MAILLVGVEGATLLLCGCAARLLQAAETAKVELNATLNVQRSKFARIPMTPLEPENT